MTKYRSTPIQKLPNQAGDLFNPDNKFPLRQKHLFVVRFVRSVGVNDQRDLTFIVKTIDRPSVESNTETINQYNKKKLIHTGVKYNPVNATFYDTADNTAIAMWIEYAKYHYADYTQGASSYADDLLNQDLLDKSLDKVGWGFRIPAVPAGILDGGIGMQNFFSAVEVYQVWGNQYTCYQLVNPRITSFNPDELSYDSSDASTVSVALQYEAIDHINGGQSQYITQSEILSNYFQTEFGGSFLELETPLQVMDFTSNGSEVIPITNNDISFITGDENTQAGFSREELKSDGGVLSRFGKFDFGSIANTAEGRDISGVAKNAIRTVLSKAALAIPGLATGVNRAASATGTSLLDQVSKEGGVKLSGQSLYEFNQLQDGTFLLGNSNDKI